MEHTQEAHAGEGSPIIPPPADCKRDRRLKNGLGDNGTALSRFSKLPLTVNLPGRRQMEPIFRETVLDRRDRVNEKVARVATRVKVEAEGA